MAAQTRGSRPATLGPAQCRLRSSQLELRYLWQRPVRLDLVAFRGAEPHTPRWRRAQRA
jgi:hypothetical protein